MVSLTARALQSLMRTRTIRNTKAITKAKAIGGHWGVNIDDAGHINKFQLTDKHGDVLIRDALRGHQRKEVIGGSSGLPNT